MRLRATLVTGTIVSLAVTAAWAWLSALAIGPAGPLHLTWRHPARSYVTLAAAPAGNATSWPRRQAWWPSAAARWLLPTPTGP
jgi:hypothetical protein